MQITIETRAGVKQGAGPIMTALGWSRTARLDRGGSIGFEMPLADPRADLVTQKYVARCEALLGGAWTDLGAGIVERRNWSRGKGAVLLTVEGDDLLSELADLNVGDLDLFETEQRDVDSVKYEEDAAAVFTNWDNCEDNNPATYHAARLGPKDLIYIGEADVFDRIVLTFIAGYENADRAAVLAEYWDGAAWQDTEVLEDGTDLNGATYGQNGEIRFVRYSDWATKAVDGETLYWIRLHVDQSLDNDGGYVLFAEADVIEESPTATALSDIMGVASVVSAGWTVDAAVHAETQNTYFGRFRGEASALQALSRLAEYTGEHFRLGAGRTIQWLQDDETVAGVRAVRASGELGIADNDAVVLITRLRETDDSFDLVTRIMPYGAGSGAERLTLALTNRSAPAGYTLSLGTNTIISSAQETALGGYRCERPVAFKDIGPSTNYGVSDQNAADMLFDAAMAWLQRHDRAVKSYALSVTKLPHLLAVGELLPVVYREYVDGRAVIDIDEALWILEVTHSIDGEGVLSADLVVADLDVWPSSDDEVLGRAMEQMASDSAHAPSAGSTSAGASNPSVPIEQGCRVYRSSAYTVAHSTQVPISFDQEVYDTDDCWAVGDPTKLVAKHAGYYQAGGQVSVTQGGTAGNVYVAVRRNGSGGTWLAQQEVYARAGKGVSACVATGMFYMNVNDYVEIIAIQVQDSGSASLSFSQATAAYQQFNNGWLQRVA